MSRRTAAPTLLVCALSACFNPPSLSTDGDTDEPATTQPTTTQPTSGPDCDCPDATPYCPDGACVACTAIDCAAMFPAASICDPASGQCVGCMSTNQCGAGQLCHPDLHTCVGCTTAGDCTPELPRCDEPSHTCAACTADGPCAGPTAICDPVSGTCRGCREHTDCDGGACDLDNGLCFPAATTRHGYVDEASCAPGNSCLLGSPCCEIADALTSAALDLEYAVLHVAPGEYAARVEVGLAGKKIALLAESGAVLAPKDAGTPLRLAGSSALFVAHLAVISAGGAPATGVDCASSNSLWFDDGEISKHAGAGARAQECTMHIRRTRVIANATGVLAAPAGRVYLENSVVSAEHVGQAVTVVDDGQLHMLYSTVVDHRTIPDDINHLLGCDSDSTVDILNSVLVDNQGAELTLECQAGLEYSASTVGNLVEQSDTNETIVAADVQGLFMGLFGDDLDIPGEGSQLADVARWQPGQPPTDIHGAARPSTPDASDAAGADLPGP